MARPVRDQRTEALAYVLATLRASSATAARRARLERVFRKYWGLAKRPVRKKA